MAYAVCCLGSLKSPWFWCLQGLFAPVGRVPPGGGPANYSFSGTGNQVSDGFKWNNQAGASGPWPHTRYVGGRSGGGGGVWTLDLSTPTTTIVASDHLTIYDDDLVGHVSVGGDFCLDIEVRGVHLLRELLALHRGVRVFADERHAGSLGLCSHQ